MDNYVMINGTKYEIDDSAKMHNIKKLLGIANPFAHRDEDTSYWLIGVDGDARSEIDIYESEDDSIYNNCNYFSSEKAAEQVALHQLLYRKLLKYAYDNDVIDRQAWNGNNRHYYIIKDTTANSSFNNRGYYIPCYGISPAIDTVYFATEDAARSAIAEVVIPFMEKYPEFMWGSLNLSE